MKQVISIVLVILTVTGVSHSLQSESFECGKIKIEPALGEDDTDSGESYRGQFPWYTAVYHVEGFQKLKYICGGTLVSRKFVLSAASCVVDGKNNTLKAESLFVQLGVKSFHAPTLLKESYRKVQSYHIPEEYYELYLNDICLLELNINVKFNDFIQPACVSHLYQVISPSFYYIGWQKALSYGQSTHQIIHHGSNCYAYFGATRACLFSSSKSESILGAGSYINAEGIWYVIGVGFSEPSCKEEFEMTCAFFSVTYEHAKWIKQITNLPYLHTFERKNGKIVNPQQTYPSLLPRHCGNFIGKEIVSSQETHLYEFPWMALVGNKEIGYSKRFEFDFTCVGTIISKRYVLTSSTCALNKPNLIRLGVHDIGNITGNQLPNENDCAPLCKDYDIEFVISSNQGIGLIRTAKDVAFEDQIQPICLAGAPGIELQYPHQFIITSWNYKKYSDDHPTILKKTVISAPEATECDASPSCLFENSKIDGLDEGAPVGYPVHHNNGIKFVQFGIHGIAVNREIGFPYKIYNITNYIKWIMANMES